MTPEAAAVLTRSSLGEITRDELMRRLNDPSLTIVDALPQESYKTSHIPRSINIPASEIEERALAMLPDRAAEIAVYCAKFT